MFYSNFVLVAKGPLAQVWISAHANRKLTKQQIQSTNIDATSKSILEPATPFALRLSGQLLLGLVRIYSRKVKYLFEDCSASFNKMKTLFKPSEKINLSADQSTAAANAITLPEVSNQIEFAVPLEFDIADTTFLQTHLSQSQMSFDMGHLEMDPHLHDINAGLDIGLDVEVPRDGGFEVEVARGDRTAELNNVSDFGNFDINTAEYAAEQEASMHRAAPDNDLDFTIDHGNDTTFGGNDSIINTPAAKKGRGAAAAEEALNNQHDDHQVDFDVPSPKKDASVIVEKKKAPPKRKVVPAEKEDVVVELDNKAVQKALENTSDITRKHQLLSKRPKIDIDTFDDQIYLPALAGTLGLDNLALAPDLLALFKKSVEGVRAGPAVSLPVDVSRAESKKKSAQAAAAAEEPQQDQGYIDFDIPGDYPAGNDTTFGDNTIADITVNDGDITARAHAGEEEERFFSATPGATSSTSQGDKPNDLLKTRKMLAFLQQKIHSKKDSLSLHEQLGGYSKPLAAGVFYQLLVLKTLNHVELQQSESYGDVTITQGPAFNKEVLGQEARDSLSIGLH